MSKKILLVDDKKNILAAYKFALEKKGYEVLTETSGEAGYVAAIKYNPDIIIMDNKMPGLSGWETAKKIKDDKVTSHIPIIGLTAYNGVKEHELGRKNGLTDIILKPAIVEELIYLVEKYTS